MAQSKRIIQVDAAEPGALHNPDEKMQPETLSSKQKADMKEHHWKPASAGLSVGALDAGILTDGGSLWSNSNDKRREEVEGSLLKAATWQSPMLGRHQSGLLEQAVAKMKAELTGTTQSILDKIPYWAKVVLGILGVFLVWGIIGACVKKALEKESQLEEEQKEQSSPEPHFGAQPQPRAQVTNTFTTVAHTAMWGGSGAGQPTQQQAWESYGPGSGSPTPTHGYPPISQQPAQPVVGSFEYPATSAPPQTQPYVESFVDPLTSSLQPAQPGSYEAERDAVLQMMQDTVARHQHQAG